MRVGVVGASGYAGGELLRLLSGHPSFEVTYAAAGSNAGEPICSVHPHLTSYSDQKFSKTDLSLINDLDLVFIALPHGESAALAKEIKSSVKVIDLGADFRLQSAEAWQKYYGGEHAGKWIYGLPEIGDNRSQIKNATRVANPGCYATAITLGIAPAVTAGLIDASDITVVAASGTTGAGRTGKINLSASEIMNSMSSYKFGGVHQHTPEVEEALTAIGHKTAKISFTPILAPMPRGILATITARTSSSIEEVKEQYEKAFGNEEFISILPEGRLPETSSLIGSNGVQMQIAVDSHTSRLIVSVAIDNLGKGAAGQAIQNANLVASVPENAGLTAMGVGQ